LLTFSVWSNYVYDKRAEDPTYAAVNVIIVLILIAFAVYFAISEFKQLVANGLSYFLSLWNYLDVLPLIFVIINGLLAILVPTPNDVTVAF